MKFKRGKKKKDVEKQSKQEKAICFHLFCFGRLVPLRRWGWDGTLDTHTHTHWLLSISFWMTDFQQLNSMDIFFVCFSITVVCTKRDRLLNRSRKQGENNKKKKSSIRLVENDDIGTGFRRSRTTAVCRTCFTEHHSSSSWRRWQRLRWSLGNLYRSFGFIAATIARKR